MAGINIVTVRVAVITALQGLTGTGEGLEGVTVDYGYVGKHDDATREYLYGSGNSDAGLALAAMADGERIKRTERATWALIIRVTKLGQETTQTADQRAAEIGAVVENYIAANWREGGALVVSFTGFNLNSWVDPDGAHAVLTYALTAESYLT